MKIAAIARSLNEERFIKRFCQNHQFCDVILIADGGSVDNTVHVAKQQPKTIVRRFDERIQLDDGSFRNPEPQHINFLLDWADEEGAEWVIVTDIDTWPNTALQYNFRSFVNRSGKNGFEGILATQIYLWGEDKYFPKISNTGASQYAWRTDLGIRYPTNGTSMFEVVAAGANPDNCLTLKKPYVVLHYISDPEREEAKMKRYESWGYPKTHLLDSIYAPPVDLPDWIKEYQV